MPLSQRYSKNQHGVMSPPDAKPFAYSDGDDAEKKLYQVLSKASDRSVLSSELVAYCNDWVTYYHLSPLRSNLMRPVRHLLQGRKVLELGAGCGAITRYLGETAASVVAVEGSARRASINALRCSDLPNVTVVNDSIQAFESDDKYDVVTLIGVLEYARMYDRGDNPELALLKLAKQYLAPGGRFLLAIENQLGLKYFGGTPEDHIGLSYYGLHGLYKGAEPHTFGRRTLENLLHEAGYSSLAQMVPLPDYKLPVTVLMQPSLDGSNPSFNTYPFLANSTISDMQMIRSFSFSMEATYKTIAENGLLPELCNSFFYVAAEDDGELYDKDMLAFHYGSLRRKEFMKETRFVRKNGEIKVQREKLSAAENLFKDLTSTSPDEEVYLPYETLFERMITVVNTVGWTENDLATWAKPWIEQMREESKKAGHSDMLPSSALDMTPCNLLIGKDETLIPFDLEWQYTAQDMLPIKYVIFRGLLVSFERVVTVAPPKKGTPTALVTLIRIILALNELPLSNAEIDDFLQRHIDFMQKAANAYCPADTLKQRGLFVRPLA